MKFRQEESLFSRASKCGYGAMARTMKLSLDDVVQRVPDQIAAEVDDDVLMVNVETGYYYAVSDVAREIWEAIERPTKVSKLIDQLSSNHDVDRSTCEEQTISFLESLLAERLAQVNNGPNS